MVTVALGIEIDEAKHLLHKHRIENLLVVSEDYELVSLITIKNIEKAHKFPDSIKDAQERPKVGVALGTSSELLSRAEILIKANVDVVVPDTSHSHSQGVIDSILKLRSTFPELQLIGGNISNGKAAKIEIGTGSISTTRMVAGRGGLK